MKKDILSLKSIYQFLVVSDYPVFCPGIIKKNGRKGLTLTKFWKEVMLIDFRNRKCGKLIWREEGGRNRYISDICNRSERLPFFREYAEEIYCAAGTETVLRQIRQFQNFLLERQFSYEAFVQKLPLYIDYLSAQDDSFSAEAVMFFRRQLDRKKDFEGQNINIRAFFCGYFLTFLMFHALAGNGEGESVLRKMRENGSLSIEELLNLLWRKSEKGGKAPVFLTGRDTELCAAPLKTGHFFGRERELYELRQVLESGGKYLISGMGGIGKTELLRQLLKYCQEEKLVDYICVVQYRNNLVDSLIKAFPGIQGSSRENNFNEALARIRIHASERVLLMIDNFEAENPEEEEELGMIRKLHAAVFITSRCQALEGFDTFKVEALSREGCSLVFRDAYGMRMTEGEIQQLNRILDNSVWRHTMTLRLLGSTARVRDWTIRELWEQLQRKNSPLLLNGESGYESLKQFYHGLYALSGLKKDRNGLLRAFVLLPYEDYSLGFIRKYLSGFLREGMDVQECLDGLWIGGWLERHGDRYSMNPLIAECLSAKSMGEKDLQPFLTRVMELWETKGEAFQFEKARGIFAGWYEERDDGVREKVKVTLLALQTAQKLKGRLSGRLTEFLLFAMEMEYYCFGASAGKLDFLQALKRNRNLSDSATVYLYMLLCRYGYKNVRDLNEVYGRLSKCSEISADLLHAFAEALGECYAHLGRWKEVQALTEYLWESSEDSDIRMGVCLLKATLVMNTGDYDGYEEWLKKGIRIGTEGGREKSNAMQELMLALCSLYIALHRPDEAERILREEEALLDGDLTLYLQWKLLFYRGDLALYREEEGYGIEQLRRAHHLAKALFEGREDDIFADSAAELAMAYNKAGMRKDAENYYVQALSIYERLPELRFSRYRILVNMSVMYLDWEKPEEALECLTKAAPAGAGMGGLAEAELNNNFSRAWGMLGKRKEELDYLQKAIPVLEQAYGASHPKVTEAKRRLRDMS